MPTARGERRVRQTRSIRAWCRGVRVIIIAGLVGLLMVVHVVNLLGVSTGRLP